ncbi:RagB/SusD family nutrient uptake outer membrane protein [Segatella salivae]|uniref:RagB/SusD family nutrient uptake outer membrane protein n=1 Tax=Segatella salivae TaxID=228604 RepID=UPI00352DE0A8
MKIQWLYIFLASSFMLVGCDNLLDKDPRDTFINNKGFWSNDNQVSSYSNGFYEFYGTARSFYFTSLNDDQANPSFDNWTFTTVPNKSDNYSGNFSKVRQINYMLDGLETSTLSTAKKTNYAAIARLNRAWIYYQLVKMYGDIQWESHVIGDINSDEVYGPRTDRDVVIDSVLQDLNYAIQNIPNNTTDKTLWSKEMALAMKSDICLYEGTFCKYRTQADNGKAPDLTRANRYLQECVNASEELRTSGKFQLNSWTPNTAGKIYTIYNSLDLSTNKEVIFYNHYEKDVKSHGLCDFTCSSTTQSGITKDAVDAFLFKDGKPLSTTTLNKNDEARRNAKGHYSIAHLLNNKDKRLSLLIDSIICFKNHGWIRNEPSPNGPLPAEMTSSTGYSVYKYDNPQMELYYRTNANTNYTDIPLFWLATVLLNDAEAKAEMGTITQADLDNTVNLLQTRAELPPLTLNPTADPANNMGVSNLIWELRRTRRCELMCDLDYRYWDLVRWHQLDKLDSNLHPTINYGANIHQLTDKTGLSVVGDYLKATSSTRSFNSKYYQYPIPSNELELNKKEGMKQNPGWE